MKMQKPMPYGSISATLPVGVKARLLQAADADFRTPSSMLSYLLSEAIAKWWHDKGATEPTIDDPVRWMIDRANGKLKTEE